VRGAVNLRASSVGIDNRSGIRDERQLLDHRGTDRWTRQCQDRTFGSDGVNARMASMRQYGVLKAS